MELMSLKEEHQRACFLSLSLHHLRVQQEGITIYNPGRELFHQSSTVLAPWPWTSTSVRKWISIVSATQAVLFCYGSPSWLICLLTHFSLQHTFFLNMCRLLFSFSSYFSFCCFSILVITSFSDSCIWIFPQHAEFGHLLSLQAAIWYWTVWIKFLTLMASSM